MKTKVEIEKSKCIGCGTCVALCSSVFKMSDDNKAEVMNSALSDPGCSKNAESSCPVQCIKVTEE